MQYINYYSSPIGRIVISSNGAELTGLWFCRQKYYGGKVLENETVCEKAIPVLEETKEWLDIYFAGKEPGFMPALHLEGSDFRMSVWEILQTIPYGQTMTYGEISKMIAVKRGISRMSAQAVGGAVGHNPIGIIVPCHRVVGAQGNLTGYAGGLDKKVQLLKIERVDMANFYLPGKGEREQV